MSCRKNSLFISYYIPFPASKWLYSLQSSGYLRKLSLTTLELILSLEYISKTLTQLYQVKCARVLTAIKYLVMDLEAV